MTTLVSATRGLRLLALLSSDRRWFAIAVAVGLFVAGLIVEILVVPTMPDFQGVGL